MKITHFKTLESTNQYLQNLLNEGVDIVNNIVVTDFQTSGKGQGKNVWQSEDGKNLLFSVALDMSFLKAENQFLLTQMVSVTMINVLKKYLPEESLFIKWPNDIYFNDKKIAGILIKNEIKGMMMGTSIIGIGLNVNQTSFDESLPNPISMKMITGKEYNLETLLNDICFELKTNANNQQPTANSYTDKLYRYKQWASYEHEGAAKEMMIIGYDQFGRLILKEKNDREVVCDLKEISFV
ncbi:MAG: biotin--[Bacteroidales bacterium]|nr:biotin--[acetyl-CoA-carboxylase] ligase [Bacteroidales bacterium]